MKILITGGAGFIGSHTADALIAQGHEVRILDNLHPTVHPKGRPGYLPAEVEFMEGDVRDKDAWKKALAGVEVVYHLAAYQDYLTDFSTFFHVNSVSTALLYELLVELGDASRVRKVIVAASQAVMGEGRYQCPACHEATRDFCIPRSVRKVSFPRASGSTSAPTAGGRFSGSPSDESVIAPCNQYAISKYSQETIAIQLGRRYGIPSVAMRYSIVQGPRQSFYNAYSGAMRIFALSLWVNRPPVIYEDGHQVRDFVNIDDVVAANLLVLTHPEADYQVFNVGGGVPWTVSDFYARMQHIVGKRIEPRAAGHIIALETPGIFFRYRQSFRPSAGGRLRGG